MAIGNIIQGINLKYRFGLLIITKKFDQNRKFTEYSKFHVSKKGLLIGTWGSDWMVEYGGKPYSYRDYLGFIGVDVHLLRVNDDYLIFKTND